MCAGGDASRPALCGFDHGSSLNWGEYAARVGRIAGGLAAIGVGKGDTVGMLLSNRPEFQLVDNAALHLGAIPFSMYSTSPPEQIAYLLENARNRILVTERQFLAVLEQTDTGAIEHLIVVDADPGDGGDLAALEAGAGADFDLEAAWRSVEPEDVATLIYTSGTTGPPKGVELTHRNILSAVDACMKLGGVPVGAQLVSYLPHAHIADRLMGHYYQLASGGTVTTVADPTRVMEAVAFCRPSVFIGVPRVWEKLQSALVAGFRSESPERHSAIEAALEGGFEKVRAEQAGDPVPAPVGEAWMKADEQIFTPIRARLGFDRATWLLTGSAPIPRRVHEFFCAIGLPICEGWGLSECVALGAVNAVDRPRIGWVGRPLPGTELKQDEDGELLLRGPQVMRGYRDAPEQTAAVLDADGWLRTGDIGEVDREGWVRIIDRKKELIISAGGKNMSPANIEEALKRASKWIGQACCIGDGRPYNVALLVLDPEACAAYIAEHDLGDAAVAALAADERIRAEVDAAVEQANRHLARAEQIKRYALLPDEWLPSGDELTPTMKLKRRVILAKYGQQIEELYRGGR
ncbi:MAG: long-chain fatty acid--CoA ligase [Actinobacteria bacterium]|nr:long-chain fatty acid--CoA ligase [Actinomycetota bacterium]